MTDRHILIVSNELDIYVEKFINGNRERICGELLMNPCSENEEVQFHLIVDIFLQKQYGVLAFQMSLRNVDEDEFLDAILDQKRRIKEEGEFSVFG